MTSKKILLIAFFYPPSRSSGVYRALALGNYLAEQGHSVTVLTTTEAFFELESGPPDYSLLDKINAEITVIRVPFTTRPAHRGLNLLSRRIARVDQVLKRLLPKSFHPILSRLALRSSGAFYPLPLADRYRSWYGPAVEAITERMDTTKIDAIIATGNPWTSFAVARSISQLSGAQYCLDYRDPWKINVRTGGLALRSYETDQLELEMLEGAAFVTHPNQHLADEYARLFPSIADKLHVMENGFDPESLPEISNLRPIRKWVDDELVIGALGTVSDMWPLVEFGEAWNNYVDGHTNYRFNLAGHLGWFNTSSGELKQTVRVIGAQASYVGPRARADVPEFYASLDVVVIFAWGKNTLTAGKMYEVAAIGLPILCIQPEGGGIRSFLERDHPRAICVDPDPILILDGLRRVESLSREMTVKEREEIRASMSSKDRRSLLKPIDIFLEERAIS